MRAYQRSRGGKRHRVGAYTQLRQAGHGEAGNAPGLLNVSDSVEVAQALTAGAQSAPQPVVIVIGGLLDRWWSKIVGGFFNNLPLEPGDRLFDWDERNQIEAYIASLLPGTPVRLVGHSWGGDTAAQIAAAAGEAGRPIDMLVTTDPVGRGVSSDFFNRVNQGAGRWININAAGGSSLEFSNLVAGIGSPWDTGPMGYASAFVNAPSTHQDFRGMMETRLDGGRTLREEVMAR